MSPRVSFADLLKAGEDKDKQRLNLKLAPPVLHSVAPEKDFSKMPNSIKRAVEDGKFPNSSLAIYLYLYSLTRGAIQPKRSVRVNKSKLSIGANLRSEKALIKNLAYLKNIGLVKIKVCNGDHLGNEFEVFVPEEIEVNPPTYLPTKQPTYLLTKSTPLPTDFRSVGRWVQIKENKDTYEDSNTSFKDFKSDDEPAALLESDNKNFFLDNREVREASKEGWLSDAGQGILEKAVGDISKKIIGKELNSDDSEKLKELVDLLVMELEIAVARTDSVTNVPAFLTEHLRRRLSGKPNTDPAKKVSAKSGGKSSAVNETDQASGEIYRAEALTSQAKETVLKTMRQYIEKGQREFVMSLRDTYTAEDWKWLSENLLAVEPAKK